MIGNKLFKSKPIFQSCFFSTQKDKTRSTRQLKERRQHVRANKKRANIAANKIHDRTTNDYVLILFVKKCKQLIK